MRTEPEHGAVLLTLRRVYILPTRHGVLFALLLALMLTGSINYNLSLGYVLTFLLGTMGIVSILHTYRNLAALTVRPGKVEAVFAGEEAAFTVCLENPGGLERFSIAVGRTEEESVYTDVPPHGVAHVTVKVPAKKRGWLFPGRFTLCTRFPLGLFRSWSYVNLGMRCVAYPRPEPASPPPPTVRSSIGEGIEHGYGNEDFAGLRPYHLGDSPRHVAWKAVAREQGLLTKQFSGRAEALAWFDWEDLVGMDTEARLSRLTRWVLDADAKGVSYGLRLPGQIFNPSYGERHRQQCLEALALFGER